MAFTQENTTGYTDQQLHLLNDEWEAIAERESLERGTDEYSQREKAHADAITGRLITIRSTNEAYGMDIVCEAYTLDGAVALLQRDIRDCGPEFCDVVVTPDDYEVVTTCE